MPRATYLKRKVMVDRKMQLTVLGYTIMVAALVTAMNFIFFEQAGGYGRAEGVPMSIENTMTYCCLSLLLIAGLVIVNLEITGRIAGPVFRLKNQMDSISQGAAPKLITFRRHDQFQDLAEAYNRMVERIQSPEYCAWLESNKTTK